MDIDLSVLKLMESEREIPFDELVVIIEQAILTAYEKHTGGHQCQSFWVGNPGTQGCSIQRFRSLFRVHTGSVGFL